MSVRVGSAGAPALAGSTRSLPRGAPRARVAVLGGGITGLAAAHRLAELGLEPVVFERSDRWGGLVLTERVDGFLVEGGADSFLARKPWAAELCRRVGLGADLVPTDATNRGAFVLRRGRLHPLPEGLTSMVPTRLGPLARTTLLSPREKLRLLLEPMVPRGRARDDESLAAFFRRRLGSGASRALVEPLVRGIYGGDPGALSVRATFPGLPELERRHRSLLLGLARERDAGPAVGERREAGFLSLRDGLGSLTEALVRRLPAEALRAGCGVAAVTRSSCGGRWRVATVDGGSHAADAVLVALPAGAAAEVLGSLDPVLARALAALRHGSSVTVALGWERARVRHPLRGHGFVVSQDERAPLLACTWASSKLPGRAPEGAVLLRAFLADPEPLLARDDADLLELALGALRRLLGLEGEPRLARVHRWARGLPRYEVGHAGRVAEIEAAAGAQPGLFLAGAAYHGLGVPDCVRSGEAAAEAAATFVATGSLPAASA